MVLEPVHCIYCGSTDVLKHGHSDTGKQRYRCCNDKCSHIAVELDIRTEEPRQMEIGARVTVW